MNAIFYIHVLKKIDFELFLGISVAKNFEIDSWEYNCAVSIGFIEAF